MPFCSGMIADRSATNSALGDPEEEVIERLSVHSPPFVVVRSISDNSLYAVELCGVDDLRVVAGNWIAIVWAKRTPHSSRREFRLILAQNGPTFCDPKHSRMLPGHAVPEGWHLVDI